MLHLTEWQHCDKLKKLAIANQKEGIEMENLLIILLLLVAVILAGMRARKHFHGGCCGSGGNIIRDKKTLTEPKLGEKTLLIQGMSCNNCEIRVENALNRLDGVAASVSFKKKRAIVSYSQPVTDQLLKQTVERLGYQVTEIK